MAGQSDVVEICDKWQEYTESVRKISWILDIQLEGKYGKWKGNIDSGRKCGIGQSRIWDWQENMGGGKR